MANEQVQRRKYAEEYDELQRQLSDKEKEVTASENELRRLKGQYYSMKNSNVFRLLRLAKQMKTFVIDVIQVLRRKKKVRALIGKGASLQSGAKRMEDYRYYLYELGFKERVLSDLEKIYSTTDDHHLKRLTAWELFHWYASKKTAAGAKRAMSYIPAAIKGADDPDLIRQAAILVAENLSLLDNKQKAQDILQKALSVWNHPELRSAMLSLEAGSKEIRPTNLSPGEPVYVDVVFAADFRLPNEILKETIEEIHINQTHGLKTGLLPLAIYDFRLPRKIDPSIQEMIDGDDVQMLSNQKQVDCDLLIIKHPRVLEEKQELLPKISARMVRVVMATEPDDNNTGYSLRHCSRNLLYYADKQARWHPKNEQVRSMLNSEKNRELKYIKLASQDWHSKDGSRYEAFLDEWLVKHPRGDERINDR